MKNIEEFSGEKKSQENGPVGRQQIWQKKCGRRKSRRSKVESNDSPEISGREETSDIQSLPSGPEKLKHSEITTLEKQDIRQSQPKRKQTFSNNYFLKSVTRNSAITTSEKPDIQQSHSQRNQTSSNNKPKESRHSGIKTTENLENQQSQPQRK